LEIIIACETIRRLQTKKEGKNKWENKLKRDFTPTMM
jgi:hypothetical protein